ncbi:MAG: response regulator [Candidatus Obscuribacterales bacterium]|nr:response regulator [Candidatus Obscuribacterales bacterium]
MESSEVTAEVCSMAAIGRRIEDVLIVDDDDNIRMIVEMSLEGLSDWKLRQARNGREALARIEELLPDLILLDVMMYDVSIRQRFLNPLCNQHD